MRDIKFRAWGPNSKYMWPWGELGWQMTLGSLFSDKHGEKIVMQYTGMHDKNGKEIYEGDIVNMFQSGAVVSRNNVVELADFLGGHYWVTHHGKIPAYEIIGNIHENPELLEELS